MNTITNNVSKMMSLTTSDMPIYVLGHDELFEDLKRGWKGREITQIHGVKLNTDERGLTIIDENTFFIKY